MGRSKGKALIRTAARHPPVGRTTAITTTSTTAPTLKKPLKRIIVLARAVLEEEREEEREEEWEEERGKRKRKRKEGKRGGGKRGQHSMGGVKEGNTPRGRLTSQKSQLEGKHTTAGKKLCHECEGDVGTADTKPHAELAAQQH
jgi:hypothetical protein